MIQSKLKNSNVVMMLKKGLIVFFVLTLFSCTNLSRKVALSPISGFGGTGNSPSGFGGTGIVGTITGFGSIWVNGVEVELDKSIRVTSILLEKDSLKLGKQVVLETHLKNDVTTTTKVAIYYPIAGKITKVGKNKVVINKRFEVKTNQAKLDKNIKLKVGEFVAINGFETALRKWVATRINRNDAHKIFYQGLPKLAFSSSVKKVLIESSRLQLNSWKVLDRTLLTASDRSSNKGGRFLIVGTIKGGELQVDAVESYAKIPRSSSKKQMLEKLKNLVHTFSNSGLGNSGSGNSGPGNSGPGNSGPGNSGPGNSGPGNSGPGSMGSGGLGGGGMSGRGGPGRH